MSDDYPQDDWFDHDDDDDCAECGYPLCTNCGECHNEACVLNEPDGN